MEKLTDGYDIGESSEGCFQWKWSYIRVQD